MDLDRVEFEAIRTNHHGRRNSILRAGKIWASVMKDEHVYIPALSVKSLMEYHRARPESFDVAWSETHRILRIQCYVDRSRGTYSAHWPTMPRTADQPAGVSISLGSFARQINVKSDHVQYYRAEVRNGYVYIFFNEPIDK